LLQVKVKNWVDGKEGDMLNAMTAKFGSILPKLADQSLKYPLVSSIPADCCSPSTSKVGGWLPFILSSLFYLRLNKCSNFF